MPDKENFNGIMDDKNYVVRRLTPEECELLQNFPMGWTLIGEPRKAMKKASKTWYRIEDGKFIEDHVEQLPDEEITEYWYMGRDNKEHRLTDSERYKALGNSISTGPNSFWEWMLKRVSAQYTRRATMASLFDGIGGFPLIWENINGRGSCIWASEIEDFPIEVTRRHFPEDDG